MAGQWRPRSWRCVSGSIRVVCRIPTLWCRIPALALLEAKPHKYKQPGRSTSRALEEEVVASAKDRSARER
jgi:hypothetical protein